MMNEMNFKKLLAIPLALVLLLGLIAGCTGNGQTTPPPGSTTAPPGSTTAAPVTTAPASNTVLNLEASEPYTLDPALAAESGSILFVNQIFSGLVKTGTTGVLPDIATGWDISADGKTYTFHLRNDVAFQNGHRLTAADFKYSWERACTLSVGSTTAATYLSDIAGAIEMLTGRATSLSGVKVVDDYTLQVTLVKPASYFIYKLAFVTAFAVDKQNVASGANWWETPSGTGPFKLGSWVKTTSITLTQNRNYYGGAVKLGSAVFKFLAGRSMDLYETGQIDVAGIGGDDLDRATDPAGTFASQLKSVPELSLSYIGFNVEKAPFDDPLVRKAFSMAVDLKKIISLTFNDAIKQANGILPAGIPGYDSTSAALSFNITQAKALIAQSKYGSVSNLPPITITTSGYGGLIDGGLQAIINEWQVNLGVTVNVRQLEPSVFLYNLKQEKDQMFYSGWIADYPNPQDFLDILFRTGADFNSGGYSNTAVDALLDQAAAATDTNTSFTLYQQAQKLILGDAAVLPLFFGQEYVLVKPYVTGFQINPMGMLVLDQVVVASH
ncbi:oligopeptide transport system substrate-binding protein [Dehalogenimonas formicexedens]|uniref:Oligopeptide transport system substrate-binding protein n=1 Tax=Dehalogenimonas formicexedens TaxID=1839801 RepID=A0A1P8F7L2_9CHLR|nr:peptide ABC transporter substrate-binding protein [Dehalogenimonas formicexedens]APV44457.1 oligopeptide transport system substrate-binding protein [Dehalogenimonas formicexedens]